MKNIGLIVAVEIDSVLSKYGQPQKKEKIDAFEVLTYNLGKEGRLYVVECGAGEIAAAAATQFCISKLACQIIVNFGIVGGLTKEMCVEKTCVVEKVVHYDWDVSSDKRYKLGQYDGFDDCYIPATQHLIDLALKVEPGLTKVIDASADKFVDGYKNKRRLHKKFNADICEMEAAGIALTCHRNNVPFLMIKCVSDGVKAGIDDFNTYFNRSAGICLEVVDKILKEI